MSERFLYSVNPKRVIKNIPGVPAIKTPKSLYLAKDEVCSCLKLASVYRRFANEARVEKVTIANVDRLHNAKFMTEEEYVKFLEENVAGNRGSVIDSEETESNVTEEVKPEVTEETDVQEEPKWTETETNSEKNDEEPEVTEETVVEEVVEDKVEEVTEEVTEEVKPEVTEETDVETVEEVTEEKVVEESTQNNFQNKNYGGKNKHRR